MGNSTRDPSLHPESAKGGTPRPGENCRADRQGRHFGEQPPKRRLAAAGKGRAGEGAQSGRGGESARYGTPEGSAARNGKKAKT
jgi:hypothetical protein